MRSLRILAVDDNRATSFGLARLLEARGHQAATALNGLAALDMLDDFRPDVVLIDVMMPAMDGYEVTRRIRKRPGFERLPVIVISALDGPEHADEVHQAGANEFLVKPIDLEVLWKILDRVSESLSE